VLKAVGAPLILSQRRHMLSVRETTFRILRELGTRLLMIDEINSVLVGGPRQQRRFLQLLRFLSNELQVAIICAGVPEARFALLSDPQLRSRVADIVLEPWTPGPEFQSFVNMLVQGLPLRQPSPVDSGKLRRLHPHPWRTTPTSHRALKRLKGDRREREPSPPLPEYQPLDPAATTSHMSPGGGHSRLVQPAAATKPACHRLW
jgi:hypothetical protein